MNKKVLKTMIILVIVYLVVWYILKFAIPEKFVLQINNQKAIQIGGYIESHLALYYIIAIIFSFITYWLYLCAVLKVPKLTLKQISVVLVTIGLSYLVNLISVTIATYYSILAMIILPALFGANMKTMASVFCIHFLSQALSLEIRGLSTYIVDTNLVIFTIMTIECYFWLLLFYLYNNYKEVKTNAN